MTKPLHSLDRGPSPGTRWVRLDQAVHVKPPTANGTNRPMPTSYWLFRAGETSTEYGPIYWTERSAAACAEAASRRGTEFNFDYDHLSVKPAAVGNGRAAGWAAREITPAGFRVVGVTWTAPARAAILGREYRYLSPFALVDEKTREIVDVINCALTNLPATHGAQLLLAQRAGSNLLRTNTMDGTTPTTNTPAPMPMGNPPPAAPGGAPGGGGGLNPEVAEAVTYLDALLPEGDPLKQATSQWLQQHGVAQAAPEMTSMAAKLSLADGVIALTGAKDAADGEVKVMLLHQAATAPRVPATPVETKEVVLHRLVHGHVTSVEGRTVKVGPKLRAVDQKAYSAMSLSALQNFEKTAPELMHGLPTTHPRTSVTPARNDIEPSNTPAASNLGGGSNTLSPNAQVFLSAAQTPAGQRAVALFAKREGLRGIVPAGLLPEG